MLFWCVLALLYDSRELSENLEFEFILVLFSSTLYACMVPSHARDAACGVCMAMQGKGSMHGMSMK